ncbi:AraC family transcriptional regulator [Noviluteimonas gilva]|uniref:Helix-turn-helix domain-containing protein n=1 Tax=Noviluteimonas gilva TaxID=2682097 RepID=A0A7C9LHT0_9GAMM|nr:AraC family transcriptional regulator [Lysobacter gilvus]MUV14320.1 helix-turn-helix domain-containing protein [Lysobacter gilvus]
MPAVRAFLPALTLRLQLDALSSLGVDADQVRAAVGPLPTDPDAVVPPDAYTRMWTRAQQLYRRAGLPSALADAIPFGAFGALDYLVGSAETVGGSVESARLHFSMVASDVSLLVENLERGERLVRVVGREALEPEAAEFTLACVVTRLRQLGGERFKCRFVGLPATASSDEAVRQRIYGSALVMDYPRAELRIGADAWNAPCEKADAFLHATLRQMAHALSLVRQDEEASLEQAVRMRLRGALADGSASPARLARLLGVSERTLQRRLAETDRTYHAIVEDFRREESARLLHDHSLQLIEVATRLGYAEQTSFSRAFRRWTGSSPREWRLAHAAGGLA